MQAVYEAGCLIDGSCAGRLADDLAGQLQAGCPAFFQEADRTYYRASDLLQRAGTAVGPERDSLTRDALALMLQVGLPCYQLATPARPTMCAC